MAGRGHDEFLISYRVILKNKIKISTKDNPSEIMSFTCYLIVYRDHLKDHF